MFARYFVEVPLPADQVERALLDSPAAWLSAIAGARVLLHRVAEATLKDFLDRVGQAITLSQAGGAETMRS